MPIKRVKAKLCHRPETAKEGQGDRYRRPSMIVNIPDIYRMFPHHNM